MTAFSMEIAGFTGEITPVFECTPAFFRPYLTQKPPDFSAVITPADLEFEQAELLAEALQEGFRPRRFPDAFLDRAAIQRRFAEFLFDRQTLLVHGSTVALEGKAYLFTARSGTGKSTHTRLWREQFPGCVTVNDDKPFLQLTDRGVFAFGSPWSGKHGLDSNICVPLQCLCLLERGSQNKIEPLAPEQMLPMLLSQTYCPQSPDKRAAFEALVQRLARSVPLWHMHCTKDPQAAQIAYRAMKE